MSISCFFRRVAFNKAIHLDFFDNCYLIHTQFCLPFSNEQTYSRTTFSNRANLLPITYPDFQKKYLFSNEAYFWLSGDDSPQIVLETPLHSQNVSKNEHAMGNALKL